MPGMILIAFHAYLGESSQKSYAENNVYVFIYLHSAGEEAEELRLCNWPTFT